MRSGQITFSDLKPIWRIVVVIVFCQFLGGLLGLLIAPHYFAFRNFGVGGAIASPFGFLLGLVWQFSDVSRRSNPPVLLILFVGMLGGLIGGIAYFKTLPYMQIEMHELHRFRTIDASCVREIAVFDRYGEKKLLTLDAPSVIAEFSTACRDVAGYAPNHPRYTSSWYLVLSGTERLEIECHFKSGSPRVLFGSFVRKQGSVTRYCGSFLSVGLREWFDRHVVSSLAGGKHEGR